MNGVYTRREIMIIKYVLITRKKNSPRMKDLAKDTYSPIKNKPQECLECNSIINAFTQNTFAIWGASGHK